MGRAAMTKPRSFVDFFKDTWDRPLWTKTKLAQLTPIAETSEHMFDPC